MSITRRPIGYRCTVAEKVKSFIKILMSENKHLDAKQNFSRPRDIKSYKSFTEIVSVISKGKGKCD